METIVRVAAPDLQIGDVVQWGSVAGLVRGSIHQIEEHDGGVRTIRIEPVGSAARTLRPDEKIDVVKNAPAVRFPVQGVDWAIAERIAQIDKDVSSQVQPPRINPFK